jgi:deoxyribodipyrimidine photolyase
MLENFVTKMNSFYYVNKGDNKSERDWNYLRNNLKRLEQSLLSLMQQLQVPSTNAFGMPTVLQTTLEEVQSTLAAC